MKNLQGDVVKILNTSGTTVIAYSYDAWGKCTVTAGASNTIANANPIRYRGYYYDTDTGFYYLQSRYYDPAIKRFISADGYLNANGDLLGFNMYAYCGNNPVIFADYSGKSVILVIGGIAITEKVMSALFATVSVAVIGIYAISQTQVNSSQTPSISFPQAPSSESKYTVLNKEIDAGKENTKGFYRHYHPEPRNGSHVYFLLP